MTILPDGGDLFITWDQLSNIKKLEYECECYEHFNETKWITGLEKILGSKFPEKYKSYKLIAH